MGLVQNQFYHSVKMITPRKNNVLKKYIYYGILDVLIRKVMLSTIFPLFYSADMDYFAMTYGHFMNALEM